MAPSTTSPTTKSLSDDIDLLLEHYLQLLDQYTTLRTQLSAAQVSIHQNIARANFTADRGIRYGADCFDERMQATRTCRVTVHNEGDTDTTLFSVSSSESSEDISEGRTQNNATTTTQPEDKITEPEPDLESTEEREKPGSTESENTRLKNDPMRMFGILVPQALRLAQGDAVNIVECLIPCLAEVDVELRKVEIEIRRKRKYRAKAEAVEGKNTTKRPEVGTAVECSS